jgi:hypothetical protein
MAKLNWDKINRKYHNNSSRSESLDTDLENDIKRGIRRAKSNAPSLSTITKWKEEWVKTGADKHCTFIKFKQKKIKRWRLEKKRNNKI